jgi:MFS transporter, DHA2 family, multidrug resistance protein
MITISYRPRLASKRWLIIATIMMVAILEVLDSTIVNVALPNMMPALGASQDQITWVLTAYVVASAIMIPLTGFLNRRLGHRRLLITCITGFMISSFLCGLAGSLSIMVTFRLLQGAFGAALIPLSQAILRETFPLEEQGKAMAIWGIGIMAAPVLGPTIGGFITQHASWHWVFYINAPICLISLVLTLLVVKPSKKHPEKIDFMGILLMFVGIGCMQIFLDQGNSKDWFDSNTILLLSIISFISLLAFIIRTIKHKTPVIYFPIFKDRNFTLSTLCLAIFCAIIFANITLQPIMMETLFGYTPIIAGMTMSPSGLFSAVGMVISSMLMKRINVRYLLVAGALVSTTGLYYISTLNLAASQENFMIANMIIGAGMGAFMVPLSTYALATIDRKYITEGSGLFAYGRMLGTSIGISLFSTLVTRMTQTNWNQMGLHINPLNNNLRLWLIHSHMTLKDPQTAAMLQQTLLAQANMMAFLDAYRLMSYVLLALVPLVLLMKTVNLSDHTGIAH